MKDVRITYGPPGCGKTTDLMNVIDKEIEDGTLPEKIAFVSFTRKAAQEAIDRAMDRFNLNSGQLDNFRTLHSLAYYHLGLNNNDVMTRAHWREVGELLGVKFSGYANVEEGLPTGSDKGDLMLQILSLARNRRITLKQQFYEVAPDNIDWREMALFQGTLVAYKRDKCLWDFTDMLERFHYECEPINADVAIIDEAQDLSKLQWEMARHAFRNSKRIRISGDDEQAIFTWAGADSSIMLSFKGTERVLSQSYRIPKAVHHLAAEISNRIKYKKEKIWAPREEVGAVYRTNDINQIDYSEGTWLLLARNTYFLNRFKEAIDQVGVPYTFRRENSIEPSHVAAIYSWQTLLKGDHITAEQAQAVFDNIKIGQGLARGSRKTEFDRPVYSLEELREMGLYVKAVPWFDALTMIPVAQREYYRACLRSGEDLRRPPRIHIDTVHGVKGGEADNVVLMTDMSYRTYKQYTDSNSAARQDEEHKVFYVAITRAKNTLYIVNPFTKFWYDGLY